MARGTWSRTLWLAMNIRESFGGSNDPMPVDPFGLLEEESTPTDTMPYNPAILQAIQDSGKFGG